MSDLDLKDMAAHLAEHPDEGMESYTPPQAPSAPARELTSEEAANALMQGISPNPSPVADKDDDDAPVIVSAPVPQRDPAEIQKDASSDPAPIPAPVPVTPSGVVNMSSGPATLTAEDIAKLAPNLPAAERDKKFSELASKKAQYIKDLIMQGFTPTEAETAAIENMRREMGAADAQYVKDNPATGVITIDKSAGQTKEDLQLTQDEHSKLVKVKAIKLIEVDTLDLSSIEVEPIEPDHKIDYIRTMDCGLSKYSTPIPILGDYVTFRGAQMIQMMRAINYEDAKIDEVINSKASLIYEKMMHGSVLQKFDEDGKRKMSYSEFVNRYPYPDLDIGIFGILCASSPEVQPGTFTCTKCHLDYESSYNIKTIIDADAMPDEVKSRYEEILTNKNEPAYLNKLYESARKARMFKSPFTGNLYSLSVPSVGRAIEIMKKIDQNDPVIMYNAALAIYMNQALIKNSATGKYVRVDENEPNTIIDLVMTLPDEDVQMLLKQISTKFTYSPTFTIRTKCTYCGHEDKFTADVTQMVFRKAQDSYTEIQ